MPKKSLTTLYTQFKQGTYIDNWRIYDRWAELRRRHPRPVQIENDFSYYLRLDIAERAQLGLQDEVAYAVLLGMLNQSLVEKQDTLQGPTPAEQGVIGRAGARQEALEAIYQDRQAHQAMMIWKILLPVMLLFSLFFGGSAAWVDIVIWKFLLGGMATMAAVYSGVSGYQYYVNKSDLLTVVMRSELFESLLTITRGDAPRVTAIDVNDIEKTCAEYKGVHTKTWLKQIAIPAARVEIERMENEIQMMHDKNEDEDALMCSPCQASPYPQTEMPEMKSVAIHLMWRQVKPGAKVEFGFSGPYHSAPCVENYEQVLKDQRKNKLLAVATTRLIELPKLKDINTNLEAVLTPRRGQYEMFVLKFDPQAVKEVKKENNVVIEMEEKRVLTV